MPVATLTALAVTEAMPAPVDATPAAPTDQAAVPSDTPAVPTESISAPTERVPAATTLTLWHTWTDAQRQALQPALDALATQHPDVALNLIAAPDLPQALADATDPNAVPDLLIGSTRDLGELARAGRIVPLDTAGLDAAALVGLADTPAAQGVTVAGQTWAVPFSQSGLALVYNKAAISPKYLPTNPDDFDDLLQKMAAFKLDFIAQYPLCVGTTDAYQLAPVYFGFGLPAYVDAAGRPYLDTPEALAAGQWLATISPELAPPYGADYCQAMFIEGTAAMWWTGPDSLPAITAAGIDYGILPMGRPYVDGQALMVTPQAVERGHAALVAELIQRLSSAESQKALALAGAGIPVDPAVLADPEVAALPAVAGYAAALARGVPLPTSAYAAAQWDIVAAASDRMWYRSLTPAEMLPLAQADLVAEVARIAGNASAGASVP